MTLHEILDAFFDIKLTNMYSRRNINTGSTWYTEVQKTPQVRDKIHFRIQAEYNVIRLYRRDGNIDYKITYQEETDKFRLSILDWDKEEPDKTKASVLVIDNFSTYTSPEQFFQASLVHDFNDLMYEDIEMFMDLYYTVKHHSKEILGFKDEKID